MPSNLQQVGYHEPAAKVYDASKMKFKVAHYHLLTSTAFLWAVFDGLRQTLDNGFDAPQLFWLGKP
jgi:hypothetical protein